MRIAITGATGLIGSALRRAFHADGHSLTLLVRSQPPDNATEKLSWWDPAAGRIRKNDLEGQDVVIHLAGASIAASRWSKGRKRMIRESRRRSTILLSETLGALRQPPQLFLSASAIGYYGNRSPDEQVDESSSAGEGFLAEVCQEWEQATAAAGKAGIRVVQMRMGVVLSTEGGALARMLPLFKWGLGGRIGTGRQMMSWIALTEIPSVINHIIADTSLSGPVNLVTPYPVSNEEFTRTLGGVLHRPAFLSVGRRAVRLLFGEMGEELLLGGVSVRPTKLLDSGYQFRFAALREALQAELGKA